MAGGEFLEAALLYASKGWRVFPLVPRGKTPAVSRGFHKATTDPAQIREWWGKNQDYNVGIATGDGLTVIDIDDKPDKHGGLLGSDMLRDWEFEHGSISETVTAISGTGGTHYYFATPGFPIPKCESPALSIDLRGVGGYIVAPPSIHPETGEPYMWDISPEDMDPAAVNATDKACIQWVYDNRVGAKKAERQKQDATATSDDGPIREGGRNAALFSIGRSLLAKGLEHEQILASLLGTNALRCRPKLPEADVRKIADSVCSKEPGFSDEVKNAAKTKRTPQFKHNVVGKQLIDEYGACLIDGETPAIRMVDGRYRMGWDAFDTTIIDLYDDCKESNRREVKAYVKAKAPTARQSTPFLIAFKNGVLDVRTMELRDYGPGDIIPNVIPHNWNADAKSPTLDHTLERMACGNIETLMNLTEFLGMCMVRDVKMLPFFPVLIGEGSNGKSTYISLLEDVVGGENISSLQPKEIAAHFMGMHIVGKTANLGDDIASGYLDDKDCSVIKSVATGDLMFTDVKGTKGFKFRPYCTMVFSCNQFPRLADITPGFMRRLFPVEFNAVFSPSDEDFDPLIGEKLKAEETLEYACVLGVEGLRRALDQNAPTPNAMSMAMKADIAREANTGLQWFNDDSITAAHLIGMSKEEAYREYTAWCERNGYGKTAMGSGALSALIGTYFRLKCTKSDHREYSTGRRTVKVYEYKVPQGATKNAG